jgi:MgtE-like protein
MPPFVLAPWPADFRAETNGCLCKIAHLCRLLAPAFQQSVRWTNEFNCHLSTCFMLCVRNGYRTRPNLSGGRLTGSFIHAVERLNVADDGQCTHPHCEQQLGRRLFRLQQKAAHGITVSQQRKRTCKRFGPKPSQTPKLPVLPVPNSQHTANLADILNARPRGTATTMLAAFPLECAVAVLDDPEIKGSAELIERLPEDRAVALLEGMSPDRAAEIFSVTRILEFRETCQKCLVLRCRALALAPFHAQTRP